MGIRTQELEKEIMQTLVKENDSRILLSAYKDLADRTLSLAVQNQALREAVAEVVRGDQLKDILEKDRALQEKYLWRNTDGEDRSILSNYGYKKPVVLCSVEEALNTLADGYPVLLLHPDNTEQMTMREEEIEEHAKKGGLLGITQFVAEAYYEQILSMSR